MAPHMPSVLPAVKGLPMNLRPLPFFSAFVTIVFVMFLGLAAPAQAAMLLALDDPTTPGLDLVFNDADLDEIVSSGGIVSVGAFPGNFTIGVGNFGTSRLDMVSFHGSFQEGASLNVLLTQTDHTGSGTAFATVAGSTDGLLVYGAFYDPSNTPFGFANIIGGQMVFGPSSFLDGRSEFINAAGPYSLTHVFALLHPRGNPSETSLAASISVDPVPVPEPATMTLFGLGLSGAALARRRRRCENS